MSLSAEQSGAIGFWGAPVLRQRECPVRRRPAGVSSSFSSTHSAATISTLTATIARRRLISVASPRTAHCSKTRSRRELGRKYPSPRCCLRLTRPPTAFTRCTTNCRHRQIRWPKHSAPRAMPPGRARGTVSRAEARISTRESKCSTRTARSKFRKDRAAARARASSSTDSCPGSRAITTCRFSFISTQSIRTALTSPTDPTTPKWGAPGGKEQPR